jgi:hypothetical protein
MPLYASCALPSGRFTAVSEPTPPLVAPAPAALTGCHTFTHSALVQMKLPFLSALSEYSVAPPEVVSTVACSAGLEAVFTAPAPPLPDEAVCEVLEPVVADPPEPEELLPQAASASEAASVGRR